MLANNTCWIPTRRQSLPTRVVRHDMAMSVIELAWWQMTVRWLAHLGWRVVAEQRQRRAILIGVLLGLLALAAGAASSERFYSERSGISVVAPGFHSGGGNL